MQLIKKLRQACALLCIAQACLLSFASVSPQIHARVFHGGNSTEITCSDTHFVCTELTDASGKDESEPDSPEDDTSFCAVILFEQGIISFDQLATQFPEQQLVTKFVFVGTGVFSESYPKRCIQARAPPLS